MRHGDENVGDTVVALHVKSDAAGDAALALMLILVLQKCYRNVIEEGGE